MTEENLLDKAGNPFEEEITFDEKKFYNKVRDYLNNNDKMKTYAQKGCIIYLTNQLNPNQLPYSIILERRGWKDMNSLIGVISIQKNHPLGEQIKKDLEKLTDGRNLD
jgi:hypothetical protein